MTTSSRRNPVLLTRPLGQQQPLFEILQSVGRRVIAFPALSIAAAADPVALDQALSHLLDYGLAVFVSPNAIDQALERLRAPWPAALPVAVMGPGSRERLVRYGISDATHTVISPRLGADQRFDSESLFAALDIERYRGKRCLVVRGNGGRNWLIEALEQHQVSVECVVAYQRSQGLPSSQALESVKALVDADLPATVIVTSSQALASLKQLFLSNYKNAGESWLKRQQLLVSHARIAENATAEGFAAVHCSDAGDDALVRALEYLP
jgi:uroporphyrinogen III methyltransferase/synthase